MQQRGSQPPDPVACCWPPSSLQGKYQEMFQPVPGHTALKAAELFPSGSEVVLWAHKALFPVPAQGIGALIQQSASLQEGVTLLPKCSAN